MNGLFVGTWHVNATGVDELQYATQWVADGKRRRPLSLSLPIKPGNQTHKGDAVRFYFQNLLPDNEQILERVARRYRLNTIDSFSLLREIGRDCVGALQILPEGEVPATELAVQCEPLSDAQVAEVLRNTISTQPLGLDADEEPEFRIAIAGAQEKTALLRWQGQWCRPLGSTPTTHIFKLPLGLVGNMRLDLRHSVENEWLCAQLLAAYGMAVAHCEILTFEDQRILSVERFDRRIWKEQTLLRLPQEDMCQALGRSPLKKYETDGGPGIEAIMALLDGSSQREKDRYTFFKAQLLFWMLGATDGHAKNFSLFLQPQGAFEMTPLYDVLSVYPMMGKRPGQLAPQKARMAMALRTKNAHWKLAEIQRRHWQEVGQRYDITSPTGLKTTALLDEIAETTPAVIAQVQNQLPANFPPEVAEPIFQGVMAAAERLGR